MMPKDQLPRFIVYQPNPKEFHICLEVGNKFFCWASNYAPSLDIRFPREVKRIKDIPAGKIPTKNIFDKGTYAVTRTDTKATAEKKLAEGIDKKSFAFILEGKKLQGRFSFKQTSAGTVIQKYKDKYAAEEDILSGDLSRTISTMIPDYDAKKIKLNTPQKRNISQKQQEEELAEVLEEITPDKTLGNTQYHFAFYTAEGEADMCLITAANGKVIMLQKSGNSWELLHPIDKPALKLQTQLIEHARALSELN